MNSWRIVIKLYWPHVKFMFGWQVFEATEDDPFDTIEIALGFIAVDIDIINENYL